MINALELGDQFEIVRPEGALAFKDMQYDAFDEITKGDVVVFGDGFHHLENALFDADAGLDAFDDVSRRYGSLVHMYQCTKLPDRTSSFILREA